jgi:hypothetical protein
MQRTKKPPIEIMRKSHAHKSAKDYDRKKSKRDLKQETQEVE